MRISFVSNLFSHHQKELSDQLFKLTNGDYRFIATMALTDELKGVGYREYSELPYIINVFNGEEEKQEAMRWISTSDVVVEGAVADKRLKKHTDSYMKKGKLLFFYSERIYKIQPKWYEMPARAVKYYLEKGRYKNAYLLCSSAFVAADYSRTRTFLNRTFKWGYFPGMKHYQPETLMEKKDWRKILWVGRFLKWKHPDDALTVAKRLKDDGYAFSMELCGTGEMEAQLKEQARQMEITDCVAFAGAIPSDKVREYMERAGIFLFTSDRYEGWGAVLNESMNSGCAVVASHAIGAVPYLMKHGQNGLVYHSGNVDELYESVKNLLDHPEKQDQLGRAAYETIAGEWNARVAAERVLNLSSHLLAGEVYPDLYQTGPCARALCIKDEWF